MKIFLHKILDTTYVHTKDVKLNKEGRQELRKNDFTAQYLKIRSLQLGHNLVGKNVEEEAKEAIQLLITLFPEISSCSGGL